MIPTRDRPLELARAVESASAQDGVEVEVIVIDDASEQPAPAQPGVRVIRRDRSGGPAVARNAGLSQAQGDWIAFLDDDDEWAPGKLAVQLSALDATDSEWAWCATRVVGEDHTQLWVHDSPPAEQIVELLRLRNAIPGSASSVVARSGLLRGLGGFDEGLDHLADWDLWMRMAAVAPGASVDQVLVTQRLHRGGMHARDADGARAEFDRFRAKHPEVSARDFTFWLAAAYRRGGRPVRALRAYATARLRPARSSGTSSD